MELCVSILIIMIITITNIIMIIPVFNVTNIISGKREDDHHRAYYNYQAEGITINKLFRSFLMQYVI